PPRLGADPPTTPGRLATISPLAFWPGCYRPPGPPARTPTRERGPTASATPPRPARLVLHRPSPRCCPSLPPASVAPRSKCAVTTQRDFLTRLLPAVVWLRSSLAPPPGAAPAPCCPGGAGSRRCSSGSRRRLPPRPAPPPSR